LKSLENAMENVHIAILEVRLMSFVMWQLVALFPKSQSYNCGNLEDEIDKIWSTIIKVQSQNSRKFDKIISNESEEEQ